MKRFPLCPSDGAARSAWLWRILLVVSLLLFLAACGNSALEPVSKQDFIMDTSIALTLYSDHADQLAQDIFTRLKKVDDLVRVQKDTSEAWAVNAAAGREPVTVSADTLAIAGIALELSKLSGGAFDPTIGPISLLWDIEGQTPHIPTSAELKVLLPLVNWQWVHLDSDKKQIFLEKPGMQLDFGGVAKGYAALEAARICREQGVVSALLNMGDSSIYALGTKPSGKKWRIGIQNPEIAGGEAVERGKMLGVVEVADAVVVSSGSYERYFERDGKRYHHIMNPRTGFPVANGLVQVTLILPGDTHFADGLSTAVFVLGPVVGLKLIEDMPGAAAILVNDQYQVLLSSRAKGLFQISDPGFVLVDSFAEVAAP